VSGRRIGLLLLILVMGGAVDAAWFLRQNVGVGASGCRVVGGRFYGPSFSFDAQDRRPLGEGATVEVENAFGTVRVVQAAAPELHVALRKVVYRDHEASARTFADRIRLQVESGATLRVATNRQELERSDPDIGFETHLEVAVPRGTSVVVRNEHGRVEVTDVAAADVSGSFETVRVERVAGQAEVRARHADVAVSDVAGRLSLSSRHGDVDVHDVPQGGTIDVEHGDISLLRVGAVTVKATHGSLTAQDVRGHLEVHGVHTAVDADDVDGRATIETSYDPVELRRVSGEVRLKVEHGGISAAEIDGPLTAEGSYENVELERVTGPLDVRVQHGGLRASDVQKGGRVGVLGGAVVIERFAGPLEIDAQRSTVELLPAGALTEPLLARTTFGDIRLRVPDGSRMLLEAVSSGGELTVDVPGLAVTREAGGRAKGTLAGGTNPVRLFAEHGGVEVASALGDSDRAEHTDDDEEEDAPRRARE
jgi:hypothetical protein